MSEDKINPSHYKDSLSKCDNCGETIEAITVTEQLNFNRGNAVKYIWRAGKKPGSSELEDLEKALWYLDREIYRLQNIINNEETTEELVNEAIEALAKQSEEQQEPSPYITCGKTLSFSQEQTGDTVLQPGYVQEHLGRTIKLTPGMVTAENVGTFTPVTDIPKESKPHVIVREVDVGEGYRKLGVDDILQPSDEVFHITKGWINTRLAGKPAKNLCTYRRKIQYRDLDNGEIIKEGDEVCSASYDWKPSQLVGYRMGDSLTHGLSYRRPVDVPPGTMYRILELNEIVKEDDQVQFPGTTGWADAGKHLAGFRVLEIGRYRRKVQYRTLAVGETLREGDEYRMSDGSYKLTQHPNSQVGKVDEGRYRRLEDCPK